MYLSMRLFHLVPLVALLLVLVHVQDSFAAPQLQTVSHGGVSKRFIHYQKRNLPKFNLKSTLPEDKLGLMGNNELSEETLEELKEAHLIKATSNPNRVPLQREGKYIQEDLKAKYRPDGTALDDFLEQNEHEKVMKKSKEKVDTWFDYNNKAQLNQ